MSKEDAIAASNQSETDGNFNGLIVDLCPVVLDVFNLSTENHTYFSNGVTSLFGYTPDEMIQMKDIFSTLIHPEDLPLLHANFERLKRLKDGEINEFEYRLRCRDGKWRWLASRSMPFSRNENGEVRATVNATFEVTEHKHAEETLERRVGERTKELSDTLASLREEEKTRRELLRRIVFAQEEERSRIARDLHDHLGQQVAILILKLGLLKRATADPAELRRQIASLEGVAKEMNSDVDLLVHDLRPSLLDNLGLEAALKRHAQTWSGHFGAQVDLHVNGMSGDRLMPDIETMLYRIVQEALNNIAKHARAKNVGILLDRRADEVSLIIEDDGAGFDATITPVKKHGGLGLVGMRERAALVGGTVVIETSPGNGVTIFVRVPTASPGKDTEIE